jgi:phage baseplate assembly protein W
MPNKKRFIGCQYPLIKTPRGILAQKKDVDQIKADLLQLLLTNPGERVMLPEFGTPLRKLMFEPNDPILEVETRNVIVKAIARWEPRIEIQNVVVSSKVREDLLDRYDDGTEADHIMSVTISFFDPLDITEIQELKLEVPIGGGQ